MQWNSVKEYEDKNENVIKLVFEKDNSVVESVLYKYPTYNERTVICFSTQSGCPVGCRFCGTGDYFIKSLSKEEIVEQVDYSLNKTNVNPLTIKKLQLMAMSMGEPLLNLQNFIPALEELNFKYPNASLLISTSAPRIDYKQIFDISKKINQIGLQFSIHETTDEKRDVLIPFKKKLSLKEIAKVGKQWFYETGRNPFFNYCAHENNSSNEDAMRLFELFDPEIFCATISVVCERDNGFAHTNEKQRNIAVDFSQKIVNMGYNTRVFDPAGQDTVGGGCGQLWHVQNWIKNNKDKVKQTIGFGKEKLHTPI